MITLTETDRVTSDQCAEKFIDRKKQFSQIDRIPQSLFDLKFTCMSEAASELKKFQLGEVDLTVAGISQDSDDPSQTTFSVVSSADGDLGLFKVLSDLAFETHEEIQNLANYHGIKLTSGQMADFRQFAIESYLTTSCFLQ